MGKWVCRKKGVNLGLRRRIDAPMLPEREARQAAARDPSRASGRGETRRGKRVRQPRAQPSTVGRQAWGWALGLGRRRWRWRWRRRWTRWEPDYIDGGTPRLQRLFFEGKKVSSRLQRLIFGLANIGSQPSSLFLTTLKIVLTNFWRLLKFLCFPSMSIAGTLIGPLADVTTPSIRNFFNSLTFKFHVWPFVLFKNLYIL